MVPRRLTLFGSMAACVACAPATAGDGGGSANVDGMNSQGPTAIAVACEPSQNMPLEGRASPYDSTAFNIGGAPSLVCYGRPSVRGRTIFGDLVPYGQLWRTGANEPTVIHLPVAASIAGIEVEPGSYSLYTVPGEQQWEVIVNRSTDQWGIENQYEAVADQEVGRATVPAEATSGLVEVFEIRAEPRGDGAVLVFALQHLGGLAPRDVNGVRAHADLDLSLIDEFPLGGWQGGIGGRSFCGARCRRFGGTTGQKQAGRQK